MTIWTFKLRNGETSCYKQEADGKKLFLGNDKDPVCFNDLSPEFKPGDLVNQYGTVYHVMDDKGAIN